MADGIFNYAKGRFVEKIADAAANIEVFLLKANESEATLIDRTDFANITAQAGNTEADFTNYAEKTGVTATLHMDTTNDWIDVDIPDQTWASAGGTTNNTLTKLIVCYSEGAGDANKIPISHHDFSVTTDGSDITAAVNAEGFARAQ